jgi:fructoselysine-6-phosphate deglycase
MLNFDERRFLAIQSGAVTLADRIHKVITDALDRGADNLFFAGTGGAGILMQPAADILRHQSSFPVFAEMPAELVVTGSAHLGPRSLVVMPSLSGTTPETIQAMEYCQARGATVITLTGDAQTPLGERADVNFANHAADDTSSESFYLQSLLIALSVMDARGEISDYDHVADALQRLPGLLLEVKRNFEPRAAEVAERIKAKPWHIITGAGTAWPEAFYYGMCILEEMQWIRTRPVHSSDFFHGTLELVEEGVSVIVMKGEDSSRPLAERVERFVPEHGGDLLVLDTAELATPGVPDRVRALISPVLLATVLERVSAHLEAMTGHPLTTRRYYRRIAY